MEQYYCTFKYYDKSKRRLAVFCRYISSTEAELFTLTCSHEDEFNSTYARHVYEGYLRGEDPTWNFHKPLIELIEIEPERREIWTLLNYCRNKYYEYVEIIIEAMAKVLVKGTDAYDIKFT